MQTQMSFFFSFREKYEDPRKNETNFKQICECDKKKYSVETASTVILIFLFSHKIEHHMLLEPSRS